MALPLLTITMHTAVARIKGTTRPQIKNSFVRIKPRHSDPTIESPAWIDPTIFTDLSSPAQSIEDLQSDYEILVLWEIRHGVYSATKNKDNYLAHIHCRYNRDINQPGRQWSWACDHYKWSNRGNETSGIVDKRIGSETAHPMQGASESWLD